jgi:putative transposase
VSMKSYKYRLYPTKKQAEKLAWTLVRCCELYNAALQERREIYKYTGKGTTYNAQANQLPQIKEIREEYKEIHSQVLQDVLRRVEKAFKDFFRRVKAGNIPGFPRFQGHNHYDSFTYPQKGFSFENGRLALSKIGHVKIKLHRPLVGTVTTCTLKREAAC